MTIWQRHRIEALWIKAYGFCCSKTCNKAYIDKARFVVLMEPIIETLDADKKQMAADALRIKYLESLIGQTELDGFKKLLTIVQQPIATLESVADKQTTEVSP